MAKREEIMGRTALAESESELDRIAATKIIGPVVGRVLGLMDDGRPLIDFPGAISLHAARSTVEVSEHHIGSEILITFESGDVEKPIITGILRSFNGNGTPSAAIKVDDERLVFTAEREIVLQCGSASITLTRAGKVLIRGAYVLSRSSGANRIKGASVQIN